MRLFFCPLIRPGPKKTPPQINDSRQSPFFHSVFLSGPPILNPYRFWMEDTNHSLSNPPPISTFFPLFRVSSFDKPQLRALNDPPRNGDLRKAYEIPRGFPRYSRRTHAVFTPSSPNPRFFEPKNFENFHPATICSGPPKYLHKRPSAHFQEGPWLFRSDF